MTTFGSLAAVSVPSLWVVVASLLLVESLAVIATMLHLYRRHGAWPPVAFGLETTTVIPDALPPAVVSLLCWRGRVPEDAALATLLDLVRRRVVTMTEEPVWLWDGTSWIPGASGNIFLPAGKTYRMTLRRDRCRDLRPYEADLVRFVFDVVAAGDSLTIYEYRQRVRADQGPFALWFREWRRLVRRDPSSGGLLRAGGVRAWSTVGNLAVMQGMMAFLSWMIAYLGLAIVVRGPLWVGLLIVSAAVATLVPLSIALALMVRLPGPSRRGAELLVRYRALRRQLKITRIPDMPPPGLVMWDEFFVVAVALGMARKAINGLYVRTPNFLQRIGWEVMVAPRLRYTPAERQYIESEEHKYDRWVQGEARKLTEDLRAAEAAAVHLVS